MTAADQVVDDLLEAVVTGLPYSSGDRVALMINGLGGTPISELCILYRRAHQQLAERGITVGRSYVNEYCTSLDMAGASLTLVRPDDGGHRRVRGRGRRRRAAHERRGRGRRRATSSPSPRWTTPSSSARTSPSARR